MQALNVNYSHVTKRTWSSKKIKARFLTSANLRAEFEREDAERKEHEQAVAEKDKQKEANTAQRALRVADDALNQSFTGRIKSYKKDDLRALALALSLSDKGTNSELSSRINDYFNTHPDLKKNSRFRLGHQKTTQAVNEESESGDSELEDKIMEDEHQATPSHWQAVASAPYYAPPGSVASGSATSMQAANVQSHHSHSYSHQHQAFYTHIPNNQYFHYGWHYQPGDPPSRVGPPSQTNLIS